MFRELAPRKPQQFVNFICTTNRSIESYIILCKKKHIYGFLFVVVVFSTPKTQWCSVCNCCRLNIYFYIKQKKNRIRSRFQIDERNTLLINYFLIQFIIKKKKLPEGWRRNGAHFVCGSNLRVHFSVKLSFPLSLKQWRAKPKICSLKQLYCY